MFLPTQQHDPHIECPHCRRHTIVRHGESEYVCLNCNFRRDLTQHHFNGEGFNPFNPLLFFGLFGLLFAYVMGGG